MQIDEDGKRDPARKNIPVTLPALSNRTFALMLELSDSSSVRRSDLVAHILGSPCRNCGPDICVLERV
jgi:hypothetical protein